jgi:hypothetical protein
MRRRPRDVGILIADGRVLNEQRAGMNWDSIAYSGGLER